MKAKVIALGFMEDKRVQPGTVIDINPEQFSDNWMELVSPSDAALVKRAKEALKNSKAKAAEEKAAAAQAK